ncbi:MULTISPECIES: tetratricopeptide repeat protein [unclassified Streptomyces]|uniref:tetratricopeptide repeat protein n=1 Tax=unclassified Streptomyces TaxID=2593676 RepID=UPI00190663EE|nr:tetratricopeptide repeat protein [Streptomyces sp. HSG2]
MARLSRDRRRDDRPVERPFVSTPSASGAGRAGPLEVRVRGEGPGSVDGVPVSPGPGESVQAAVLDRLQCLALAAGRPVLATVHDETIGWVVPLRVDPDGASHLAGDPVRATEPAADRPRAVPDPTRSAPRATTPASTPVTLALVASPTAPTVVRGTVAPPTGAFGPPPRMEAPGGPPEPPARPSTGADAAPAPSRTPPRGFDAVAEAVLGADPGGERPAIETPAFLAEAVGRIHEAIRSGRTAEADREAAEARARASRLLGPDHPEVLRLREVSAYVAFLSGDPVRALRLCLDSARAHRRTGDPEAAYGGVHGALTAWRAVRDPRQGMELGAELIELWSELAAEPGPAAADLDALRAARARMGRLADRVRAGTG